MRRKANILDQLFVYHPHPWIEQDWARVSGLPLEEVWFQAEDGTRLFGWYVQFSAASPVLLWCHGNAGNLIHRLENLGELYRLGLSVFIFDYRGYGRSSGKPSEEGLYQDALAAYGYLTETRGVKPERLVLFGRSLGAAIAAELASHTQPGALIIESAFTSAPNMAAQLYPWLPVRWMSRYRYDTQSSLEAITCPLLVIHSREDDLIPYAQGEQLFAHARAPKQFLELHGGHGDGFLVSREIYVRGVGDFLERYVVPAGSSSQNN